MRWCNVVAFRMYVRYNVPVRFNVPMITYITATSARKQFFSFLNLDEKPGQHIAVTHEGIPKLILMSFDEFEGWQETLEIMSDPKLVKRLRQANSDMSDPTKWIPWEQVKRKLKL